MKNKQTLILKNKDLDEQLVAINSTPYSYVDENYFKEVMGEDEDNPDHMTFAVQVKAIKADWIINNDDKDDGISFLRELLRQQNQDILMTQYMKMIISFLYKQYSKKIKKSLMPPYIC